MLAHYSLRRLPLHRVSRHLPTTPRPRPRRCAGAAGGGAQAGPRDDTRHRAHRRLCLAARSELARGDAGSLPARPRNSRPSRSREWLCRVDAGAAFRLARQAGRGDEGPDRAGRVRRSAARWPYAYWRKFVPGAEHPRIVRAPRGGGPEQVLLDGAALAAGKSYFTFGEHHHSPDHRLYAYTVDETGSESYNLRVRDIALGARPAGRHSRGRDLRVGGGQPHAVLCAARRRPSPALRLPPPYRNRPGRRSAGLRGEGSRLRGLDRDGRAAAASW